MLNENEQPLTKISKNFDTSIITHVSSVIAPIVVVLTGMLYVAGYAQRNIRLGRFGLEGAFAEPSLQAILAQGFPVVLIGSVAFGILIAIVWAVERSAKRIIEKDGNDIKISRKFAWKFTSVNARFLYVFTLVSYGFLSGGFIGDFLASNNKRHVDEGCKERCFIIYTKSGKFQGTIIEQDTQRMAIYTKKGTVLVDSDELVRIYPINFRSTGLTVTNTVR